MQRYMVSRVNHNVDMAPEHTRFEFLSGLLPLPVAALHGVLAGIRAHLLTNPSPMTPFPYLLQRYMVSRVNNNVDMAPVGRVTLVQQLQNCMPLATGAGEQHARCVAAGCGSVCLACSSVIAVCAWGGQGLLLAPPPRLTPPDATVLLPLSCSPFFLPPHSRLAQLGAHCRRLHTHLRPGGSAAGAGGCCIGLHSRPAGPGQHAPLPSAASVGAASLCCLLVALTRRTATPCQCLVSLW